MFDYQAENQMEQEASLITRGGPAEADAADFLGDLTLAEKWDNMPVSQSITRKKGHKKRLS